MRETTANSKKFSKYDFVASFMKINSSSKNKSKKEEEQAALIADAIKDHQEYDHANLATKDDIKEVTYDIKKDLEIAVREMKIITLSSVLGSVIAIPSITLALQKLI